MIKAEFQSSWEIDPVEEMRLRTWARRNYAPREQRSNSWHPVVLDEMQRKDIENTH